MFVGRQREMAALQAALAEVLSGRGQFAVLAGEPGIGTTRTAQELAADAARQGADVLWGRRSETPGAPPYWPWAQLLRSYVLGGNAARVRAEMGRGAADIADLVPDVRALLPDLPAPSPLTDPEQARFRLCDAVTAFLLNAANPSFLPWTTCTGPIAARCCSRSFWRTRSAPAASCSWAPTAIPRCRVNPRCSTRSANSPAAARRSVRQVDVRSTPTQGRWRTLAEVEVAVRAERCLERRRPDRQAVRRAVAAWAAGRNGAKATVRGCLTSVKARTT
jgi:hypothetical protein